MPDVEVAVLDALKGGAARLHDLAKAAGMALDPSFRAPTRYERADPIYAITDGFEATKLTLEDLTKAAKGANEQIVELKKTLAETEAFAAEELELRMHLQKGGKPCPKCSGNRLIKEGEKCPKCEGTGKCPECEGTGEMAA